VLRLIIQRCSGYDIPAVLGHLHDVVGSSVQRSHAVAEPGVRPFILVGRSYLKAKKDVKTTRDAVNVLQKPK